MPDLITEASFGVDVVAGETSEFRSSHQGALRVAFIGTLGHYKGCHILIEAFRMLPVGSATLKIYGRPEDFPDYSEQLHMLASQHPDISFCGTFPNSSIAQVLADVDVLVVPSLWYSIPRRRRLARLLLQTYLGWQQLSSTMITVCCSSRAVLPNLRSSLPGL
jgi:glycosyltransferase involved in cell wall biosynthesis